MKKGNGAHVINLFGGPGAGKSTNRGLLFGFLKLHDINAEEAPEFAKDCTWEKRLDTLRDQRYVFGKQYHRLFRVKDDVEVILCDSPLILSIAYAREYNLNIPTFETEVLAAFSEFNNHNFVLTRKKKYNPKGRSQTEAEAKALDSSITAVLDEFNIPYAVVSGDYEGTNHLIEYILNEFFGQKIIYKISKNSD